MEEAGRGLLALKRTPEMSWPREGKERQQEEWQLARHENPSSDFFVAFPAHRFSIFFPLSPDSRNLFFFEASFCFNAIAGASLKVVTKVDIRIRISMGVSHLTYSK